VQPVLHLLAIKQGNSNTVLAKLLFQPAGQLLQCQRLSRR
jgi:hypothetical protein